MFKREREREREREKERKKERKKKEKGFYNEEIVFLAINGKRRNPKYANLSQGEKGESKYKKISNLDLISKVVKL